VTTELRLTRCKQETPTTTSLSHSELKCVGLSTRINFDSHGGDKVNTNRALEPMHYRVKSTIWRCGTSASDRQSLAGPGPSATVGGVRLLC